MSSEVSNNEIEDILNIIDEDTAKSVDELAEKTGYSYQKVKLILEKMMDRGMITSTPEWKYREARRDEE